MINLYHRLIELPLVIWLISLYRRLRYGPSVPIDPKMLQEGIDKIFNEIYDPQITQIIRMIKLDPKIKDSA